MINGFYLDGEVKIYYEKNNFKKNRKTLLFIHGLSSNSSAWFKFEKKFEKKYNILSIDLRGHGKSQKPVKYEDYQIDKFAEDIYRVLMHEGIKDVVLICHSFGVFIGLEFLKKHQDLVNSVVLLSPAYTPPMNWISRFLKFMLKPIKIFEKLPQTKKYGTHFDYAPYEGTGDWNLRRLSKDVKNTTLRVYLYSTKQSYSFNAKSLLPKIKVPVLMIQGKNDQIFFHKNYVHMKKAIKKSKLHLIDDATHVLVLNNFPEVSSLIESFIQQ
jgi:pimeloyl-ACP methyl ester carboxylesterase